MTTRINGRRNGVVDWFTCLCSRAALLCFSFLIILSPRLFAQNGEVQATSGHASSPQIFIAFAVAVMVGMTANLYLARLVRNERTLSKFQQALEFSPATLGGFSWTNLTMWSLLSLFMELLMIRWISSEVRIFAYFKNFVLIACFLGFGLGCYLAKRSINLMLIIVPVGVLTLLIQLPWRGLRVMVSQLPALLGTSADTQVWGTPTAVGWPGLIAATLVIVPIFGLVTFFFVPMGQLVGWYLENSSRGIIAYSVNVFAGLCGILAYTFLCFWSQPPLIWFLAGGLLLTGLLWRVRTLRWAWLVTFLACLGLLSIPAPKDTKVYWSPYQKLSLESWGIDGQQLGYMLNTNDSWYQQILDLSPQFVAAHPDLFRIPVEWNAYNIPYHFYRTPESVLILGSGMGNDVAAALRNTQAKVTAVEIDPLILKLGKTYHFEKPYDSRRVQQVNDDARSYVENSHDQFDMIVFSLLDSHTTSSHYTNIRIDNYVYTREALQAAKRLLKPDGVFIVKFQVNTPWIAGRLQELLTETFGHAPVQLEADSSAYTTGGRFFITGSETRVAEALSDPVLAIYVKRHQNIRVEPSPPTTDDWPYFYQRAPGLPIPVLVISGILILLCIVLLKDTGARANTIRWHFFFLGAGFMLLEAQIVSKMALLFGTTWVVNSIVVGGLLLLILAANGLVGIKSNFSPTLAYIGLFITLLIGLLVPLRSIFFASIGERIGASILVLCLPVFFAGIVFIRSFAQEAFASDALGSNLLGAMVGGMLESASMWTGIRWLLVIAALLYLGSWLVLKNRTNLAVA